jgi:CHAT domain-containing protein
MMTYEQIQIRVDSFIRLKRQIPTLNSYPKFQSYTKFRPMHHEGRSPVHRKLSRHWLGWCSAALLISVIVSIPAQAQGFKWSDWYSLYNDAKKYGFLANYDLAIPFAKMALKAAEAGPSTDAVWGPKDERIVMCLQTLAGLYYETGRYPEAEPLLMRAVAIGEKAPGAGSESLLGQTLSGLAVVYFQTGRFAGAGVAAKRAQQFLKKTEVRAENDDRMVPVLGVFAKLAMRDSHYDDARQFLTQAKDILGFSGYKSPLQSPTLYLIALCDLRQGRYEGARINAAMAMLNFRDAYGPNNPGLARYYLLLALIYMAEHKESQAEKLFDQILTILSTQLESAYAYMSERDRLQLLETVQMTFRAYFTFCLSRYITAPDVAARMFDVLLWEKGMIAQSVGAMWARIAARGDANERPLLAQLATVKARYAQLAGNPGAVSGDWAKQMKDLTKQANDLEEQLARSQTSPAHGPGQAAVTWRDVQKQLAPGDAAVEFAHFTEYDGKSLAGRAYYVALVLTAGGAPPALVNLGEAANVEGAGLKAFGSAVSQRGKTVSMERRVPGAEMYRACWKPLEPYLKGARRVYVSPDGLLHEIPLGILPDESGKLVGEKYDLRIVTSTRNLLERRGPAGDAREKTAVLIGNPKFDLTQQEERSALATLDVGSQLPAFAASLSPLDRMRSRDQSGGKLPPLPGTQAEIQAVKSELDRAHWHAETYLGPMALKEILRRVRSPRLLHIATHGFFVPDQKLGDPDTFGVGRGLPPAFEDPMLRSGLYLAAADRALSHEPVPEGLDDGVLTAYEASTLDLHGTELVILSACETGLGEVANGEGVFGLRRAFQVAGAHYIIMSLWSVPDSETQELMQGFVGRWLQGEEIHAALRNAQENERAVVRSRYHVDDPFYWGAFILVGN